MPAAFAYARAGSAEEALALLTEHGDEAKLLAGGHSLLPLMKLRLVEPGVVVDITGLRDLSYVRPDDGHIAIGALTRHRDVEESPLLREQVPLLAYAAGLVGDPQVRNRGTIGGSLVHGDPAADLPAVALALDATMVISGPGGSRSVPADEFFLDFLTTALSPDELLTEIRVPRAASAGGWSYQKFHQRTQDWAIVGVAAVRGNAGTRVAFTNMASTPVRATAVEDALRGGASAGDAAAGAGEGTRPPESVDADADYRRHLARVLTRRALAEVDARAAS